MLTPLTSKCAGAPHRALELRLEQQRAALKTAIDAQAKLIFVAGATGKYACFVNGLFELTDETGSGPVWKKLGSYGLEWEAPDSPDSPVGRAGYGLVWEKLDTKNYYLYRAHDGCWVVSDAEDKDARQSVGNAYSEELGPDSLPTDARTWKVNIGGGPWKAQALQARFFWGGEGEVASTFRRSGRPSAALGTLLRSLLFGGHFHAQMHTLAHTQARTLVRMHIRLCQTKVFKYLIAPEMPDCHSAMHTFLSGEEVDGFLACI